MCWQKEREKKYLLMGLSAQFPFDLNITSHQLSSHNCQAKSFVDQVGMPFEMYIFPVGISLDSGLEDRIEILIS